MKLPRLLSSFPLPQALFSALVAFPSLEGLLTLLRLDTFLSTLLPFSLRALSLGTLAMPGLSVVDSLLRRFFVSFRGMRLCECADAPSWVNPVSIDLLSLDVRLANDMVAGRFVGDDRS